MHAAPAKTTIRALIAGWAIALALAIGIAYLMFSTVSSVVERHTALAPTAAAPIAKVPR